MDGQELLSSFAGPSDDASFGLELGVSKGIGKMEHSKVIFSYD